MARRQSMSWVELRVGLLVIASFALLALAMFFIGGETGFFTPKYEILVYFRSADGLNTGAEVWLEGVRSGNVQGVRISDSLDPEESVEVILSIEERHQNAIRSDSRVTIETIGLLGDKYIDVTRGTAEGEVIGDGGTLQGAGASDIRRLITGTNDILANLEVLTRRIQDVAAQIERGEGTLGKFLTDPSIFNSAAETAQEAKALVVDLKAGRGSIGRLMSDETVYERLIGALARMENIVAKVEDGQGTLGKLVTDSSLYDRAERVFQNANTVLQRLERGEGSLGKLSRDETLYNDARRTMENFTELVRNIENSEGTAGRLINDPDLYNNLNETSSEMLKLLYDFRQNPGKFLTINFRLF